MGFVLFHENRVVVREQIIHVWGGRRFVEGFLWEQGNYIY